MTKVILLTLSFFVCVNVSYSQDVTVTEIGTSMIIQDGSFKVYGFGYGSDTVQVRAEMKAQMQSQALLSEVLNGFDFSYEESRDEYVFYTETSGNISKSQKEAVYPLTGPDYEIIYVVSSDMDQSVLQSDEMLAYEVKAILNNASELRTAIGRTRAEGLRKFADQKGTNWAEGKGYIINVDFDIKKNDSIELSYTMLLSLN